MKMTQTDMVYKMLVAAGDHGVTPFDALSVGCYRLAARIKDLRDEGIQIATRTYGRPGGHSCARYVLMRDEA